MLQVSDCVYRAREWGPIQGRPLGVLLNLPPTIRPVAQGALYLQDGEQPTHCQEADPLERGRSRQQSRNKNLDVI